MSADCTDALFCPTRVSDEEGRVWECLAPRGHIGGCFLNQAEGPAPVDGDFGGMST